MSRPHFFWLCKCAVAAVALAVAPGAQAASFTANPVRLTLAAGAMSTSLALENRGDEPVLIQAELMAWSQEDGKDVLKPSEDLIVSPPIFKVAPGGTQTVRIGVLQPIASDREVTYRLFLQEVAQPPPSGQQGVSVTLRLGLPVFVLPRAPAVPKMSWRAQPDRGDIRLSLTNAGNAHVQTIAAVLQRDDGAVIAEQQIGAYVLAGQTRSWQIKAKEPWRGGKLKLTAQTANGDVTAEVSPD